MKLRHSAHTDVGRTRDHNEDDFGIGEGAQLEQLGNLFVLCDGMGGYAAGEVASRIGVETILSSFYNDTSDDRTGALEHAIIRANHQIHVEGHGKMGTTGVCALVHHDAVVVANVGDSRAYLVRNGAIRQISRDHSLVGEQVAAGLITAKDARSLNYRNVITRALGHQPDVEVDLFRMPLQKGDIVALTSDGLHGLVEDDEIGSILSTENLEMALERLVDLANERGGTDNITIVAVGVDALDWTSGLVEDERPDTADAAQATRELPATAALPVASDAPPPASAPRQAPTTERRLTMLGGLLAFLLLTVLVFAILFAQRTTTTETPLTPGVIATSAATNTAPTLTPALPTAAVTTTVTTTATPSSASPTAAPKP